jgi:iron complex outermembrane receptor protein
MPRVLGDPGCANATTTSMRWRQRLDAQWNWVAQTVTQQLKPATTSPFPCGCSTEGFYGRYCSNGIYDL